MNNYKSDFAWIVSASVRATYSPDGCVLLDLRMGLCYSLNIVAAHIWSAIEAGRTGVTLEGIVHTLERDFSVSREELSSDTAEYLQKLEHMGLVRRKGSGIPANALRGEN